MLIKDEKKCGRTLLESFIFPTTDGPISTQKAHTFLPAHIPVKMYSTGKKKNQLHQTTWNLVEMSVMDRTREKVSRTHDWHRTSKLTSWDQRSNFAYMCPNYRRSISRQIDGAKLWFLLLSLPSNFGEACFQTLMILLMVSALIILWFPPSNMQGASSKKKHLAVVCWTLQMNRLKHVWAATHRVRKIGIYLQAVWKIHQRCRRKCKRCA